MRHDLDFSHIRRIQDCVAASFGVTRLDLISERRSKEYVIPRHVAMYLAERLTRHSRTNIARLFGDRDHTAVRHALRATQARMVASQDLRRQVAMLEVELGTLAILEAAE